MRIMLHLTVLNKNPGFQSVFQTESVLESNISVKVIQYIIKTFSVNLKVTPLKNIDQISEQFCKNNDRSKLTKIY